MAPIGRFGPWAAIGVPLLLVFGAGAAFTIHAAAKIPWSLLLFPVSLYIAVQLIFYLLAFWARKQGRMKRNLVPMAVLCCLYGWITGLILIHYGSELRILPSDNGDCIGFSICMAVITLIMVPICVKYGVKIVDSLSQMDQ
jgi:cation transporter-like permease